MSYSDGQWQFWKAKNQRKLVKWFLRTFFKFGWQNTAKNFKKISHKQIHYEHFSRLGFFPSQGHNSVNIGSKLSSGTIFGIYRSRAFIWYQYLWAFMLYWGRYKLLTIWPKLYLTYCISGWMALPGWWLMNTEQVYLVLL